MRKKSQRGIFCIDSPTRFFQVSAFSSLMSLSLFDSKKGPDSTAPRFAGLTCRLSNGNPVAQCGLAQWGSLCIRYSQSFGNAVHGSLRPRSVCNRCLPEGDMVNGRRTSAHATYTRKQRTRLARSSANAVSSAAGQRSLAQTHSGDLAPAALPCT